MFYAKTMLGAKDTNLSKAWLAAHLNGTHKLRKNEIQKTNVSETATTLMTEDLSMALRILSQLLLGVTRIYARQVDYLYYDSANALLVLKNKPSQTRPSKRKSTKLANARNLAKKLSMAGKIRPSRSPDDEVIMRGSQQKMVRNEEISISAQN
ncbi:hypothetical protein MHBO_004051, partial [Bonamia ostreae]